MSLIPKKSDGYDKLVKIAKLVHARRGASTTNRDLLQWFDATRRDDDLIGKINTTLTLLGLKTEPDFESQSLDGKLEFTPDPAFPQIISTPPFSKIVSHPISGIKGNATTIDSFNVCVEYTLLRNYLESWISEQEPSVSDILQRISAITTRSETLQDYTEGEVLAAQVSLFGGNTNPWQKLEEYQGIYITLDALLEPESPLSSPEAQEAMWGFARSCLDGKQIARPSHDNIYYGPWVARQITNPERKPEEPFRIRMLTNSPLISVHPNDPISEAIDRLQLQGFSQLPVMTSERDVKGLISWQSIVVSIRNRPEIAMNSEVRLYMNAHVAEMYADRLLLDGIRQIEAEGYSLVRERSDRKIVGIVTTSDLSAKLGPLYEPFLLIRQIENRIRTLIQPHYRPDDLVRIEHRSDSNSRGHRNENIFHLEFGDYVSWVKFSEYWFKIGLKRDQGVFLERLEEVNGIRNKVMHFHPDPMDERSLITLREFLDFVVGSEPGSPEAMAIKNAC